MHTADYSRFWAKVDAVGVCWEWTGYVNPKGYGNYRRGGRTHWVHRLAWELLVGPIPDGLEIDHLCRNRRCVNPDHLEPVTRSENLRRGHTSTKTADTARAKTRCKHGHEFTPENTYVYVKTGRRQCRRCRCLREGARYRRAKGSG